jgi:Ca-activated chloride channel family protein
LIRQRGASVISKLNEDILKQIAATTNGIYVRLEESDEAVKQLQEQLSQIESKAFGDVSLMNFKAYYWWFAAAMLIFLLAESFIPETRRSKA